MSDTKDLFVCNVFRCRVAFMFNSLLTKTIVDQEEKERWNRIKI